MTATLLNLLACATCIPNADDKINTATNSAIFFMLMMLVFVLGSIFGFILYLMRRAQRAEVDSNGPTPGSFSPT